MTSAHLIWDFDGVFNALSNQPLPGYTTSGNVMFNPDIIDAVNSFAERVCEEVKFHWLSTREEDVRELATSIGLKAEKWGVIELEPGWDELDIKPATLMRHLLDTGATTVLWVDDTLGALGREFIPHSIEAILVAPDSKTGLSLDDLDALDTFTTLFCGDIF